MTTLINGQITSQIKRKCLAFNHLWWNTLFQPTWQHIEFDKLEFLLLDFDTNNCCIQAIICIYLWILLVLLLHYTQYIIQPVLRCSLEIFHRNQNHAFRLSWENSWDTFTKSKQPFLYSDNGWLLDLMSLWYKLLISLL